MANTVGFYREAWLVIAQGGWWKPREVIERIPVSIEVADAHTLLWAMANRGRYLVRRGRHRQPEFAITRACEIPKGITVGEALQAMNGTAIPTHTARSRASR